MLTVPSSRQNVVCVESSSGIAFVAEHTMAASPRSVSLADRLCCVVATIESTVEYFKLNDIALIKDDLTDNDS